MMYHANINVNLMEENINQKWITTNVVASVKKHIVEPDYICNPSTCGCENVKY